jgi:hypothetical protein
MNTCRRGRHFKPWQDNKLAPQIDWRIACNLIEIRNAR